MPLDDNSKQAIKTILLNQLKSKIDEFENANDMEKPFYTSLFSDEIVTLASILQSTYTWFGSQWEKIAKIIAQNSNNFSDVEYHYRLDGTITEEEEATIGRILRELDSGDRTPNLNDEKELIHSSYNETSQGQKHNEIIDLFLTTDNEREIYFEIKSVKPNKNEMKAAKQDLFHILAMRQKNVPIDNVDIYLTLPYNPYAGNFERWTVLKFFNEGDDLLVGKSFWDFLGGENTYEDLMEIFQQVGNQIKAELNEILERKRGA